MTGADEFRVHVTVENTPGLDTVLHEKVRQYDYEAEEWVTAPQTLGDVIVERTVAKLLADPDGKALGKRIAEITDAEIRVAVRDLIAAQLARGFRKTNNYGEPVGEVTTLTDVIVDQFQQAMKGSRELHSYNRTPGILEKLVADAVGYAFTKELAPVIEKAKKDAKAAIEQRGAEMLAEMVQKLK